MGNRTSLAAVDDPLICPGYRSDASYDEKTQSVGDTAWSIPFIWLALFREDDLVEQDVPMDGDSERVCAPLAPRQKALNQLDQARRALGVAFPEAPQLSDYVDWMLKEAGQFQQSFFTVEVVEIETLYPPGDFQAILRHCLQGFSDPSRTRSQPEERNLLFRIFGAAPHLREVTWRESLSQISGLNPELPIPPADILLRPDPYPDDEAYNFYRLMPGAELRKSVWTK